MPVSNPKRRINTRMHRCYHSRPQQRVIIKAQDDTLTLDKAVKQAKSSELVTKKHREILKGDGEDGKINGIRVKKRRPSKDKGKIP